MNYQVNGKLQSSYILAMYYYNRSSIVHKSFRNLMNQRSPKSLFGSITGKTKDSYNEV